MLGHLNHFTIKRKISKNLTTHSLMRLYLRIILISLFVKITLFIIINYQKVYTVISIISKKAKYMLNMPIPPIIKEINFFQHLLIVK